MGECPDHSQTSGLASQTVRRVSQTFERASRPLPDIWNGIPTTPQHPGGPPDYSRTSVSPPGHSAVSPDHSRIFGRATRPLPDNRDGLLTSGRATDNFQTSGRASHPIGTSKRVSRPFPDLRAGLRKVREGLLTTPGYSGRPPFTPRQPGGSPDHYHTFKIAFQPLPDIRNASIPILVILEGLLTTP